MKNVVCAFRRSPKNGIPYRRVPAVGALTWKEPIYTAEEYGDILDIVFGTARLMARDNPAATRACVGNVISDHAFTLYPDHVDLICRALDADFPGKVLDAVAEQ